MLLYQSLARHPDHKSQVAAWSIEDVQAWLGRLGLPAGLQAAFRGNAVDGGDLAGLTDGDLTNQLGCTQLQARKIRSQLAQLGVPTPAGTASTDSAAALGSESAAASAQTEAPPVQAAEAPLSLGGSAEPDPATCFQPADLRRYQQLTEALAALAALQPSLKALAKEDRHVAKYSGRKFSLTGLVTTQKHKDARLAESEAMAAQLRQQLQQGEAAVTARQGELADARRQLEAWQGKAAELCSIEIQLEQHVEDIFAAPAWRASPRQAELADALAALGAQSAEAGRGATTYGGGAQLLKEAGQLLRAALQNISQTQMINMFDMFDGGFGQPEPGHMFDDIIEMGLIRQANDEVQAAARKANEARSLLPGLPTIDDRVLRAAEMGIFQNMLFGGLGSDMVEMAMVQQSQRDVELMRQQVQAAASWAQPNLAAYQQQEAALGAQVDAKKGELQAFRRQALAAALAAGC
ncbi:TKL kinase [Micractinium conductrix]|uniref:TKL kinase n=1 Tax=Micractinium conductrix TaxID=554055 RepID=A0A2P6VP51_9CHLO|nr:TKL kinase [Micractinium conductrix]|eukprot:PSC75839.1 TKL kinase [Micractinium conductrix]